MNLSITPPHHSYDIHIEPNALTKTAALITPLVSGDAVVIITHSDIHNLYGKTLHEQLTSAGYEVTTLTVENGESAKSLRVASHLLDQILEKRLERRDTIIALGGGVIGDLAGFVAAIYLRGINFIQIPTTLLSQVDSSVGGKTGINHPAGKNLIGAFYQPNLTLIDPQVLVSLPDREIRCGLAEVIKYGIIMNPGLFALLTQHAAQLTHPNYKKDSPIWKDLIMASCKDKATVVTEDEKEAGRRETLNYGHTIGHAIEAAFDYTGYLHGEAIALGMIAEAQIAQAMGLCDTETVTKITDLITTLGFETTLKPVDSTRLIELTKSDKKVRNKSVRYIVPTQIGKTTVVTDPGTTMLKSILDQLQKG